MILSHPGPMFKRVVSIFYHLIEWRAKLCYEAANNIFRGKTMRPLLGLLTLLLMFLMSLSSAEAQQKALSWSIKHTEWSRFHRESYREFVAKIGEAREKGLCRTTDECLRDPRANPLYAAKNPSGLRSIFADCADLPHILMAYFSWMNDLPFSYTSGVSKARWRIEEIEDKIRALGGTPGGSRFFGSREVKELQKEWRKEESRLSKEDIRYTVDGNSVRVRRNIKNGDNINEILQDVVGTISTATYRIHANKYDSGSNFKDMVHVGIDRRYITPGTVLYDPAGHIAVVYKVTSDGRVLMIDAHPDNSLTRVSFGEKFARSPDIRGAGFVNFRPYKLVGAKFNAQKGVYEGGTIVAASNRELEEFSMEQFYGNPINPNATLRNSRFVIGGQNYSYYDYVRRRLSVGDLKINPVTDLSNALDDLCLDLKDRKDSVDKAIEDRIHLQDPPSKLPENIYGTHGLWETYSTPSRDARFKASVQALYANAQANVDKLRAGSSEIVYTGTDLIGDLEETFSDKTQSCVIEVTGTRGSRYELTLGEVIEKLFDLSFDPYHCIELRWGLTDPQALAECGSSSVKMQWYQAQQRLRNTIERDYTLRMDYSVRDLPSAPIGESKRPVFSLPR